MSDASALFPNSAPAAEPAPASMFAKSAPAAPAAPAAAPDAATPPPKPAEPVPDVGAAVLFDAASIETRVPVRWGEAPAAPGQVQLETPDGWDTDAEASTERQRVADAMGAVGVGPSLARELFGDFAAAVAKPVTTTREAGMAELGRMFGAAAPQKLEAAKGIVRAMEKSYPGTIAWLDQTGLSNSPQFIAKLAALAARRSR